MCGGLGKYLGIDPTLLRLLVALLVVLGIGSGILIYFILMIIIPMEPETPAIAPEPPAETPKSE